MRLVPRLQVLPGAGQVRDADAQRGIDARAEAEVGLGSGAAGLLEKPRVSKFGYEGFGGCGSEAIDFFSFFPLRRGDVFFCYESLLFMKVCFFLSMVTAKAGMIDAAKGEKQMNAC